MQKNTFIFVDLRRKRRGCNQTITKRSSKRITNACSSAVRLRWVQHLLRNDCSYLLRSCTSLQSQTPLMEVNASSTPSVPSVQKRILASKATLNSIDNTPVRDRDIACGFGVLCTLSVAYKGIAIACERKHLELCD